LLPVYRNKDTLVHGLHPLTALLLVLSLASSALLLDNPLCVALVCAGVLGLIGAAEVWGECRVFLRIGLITALLMVMINPLVNHQGEHVLVYGPRLPWWGSFNITLEAVLYGAFAGLRVFTVIAACGLLSTAVNPDDLLDLLSRLSLRSSLSAALAVRLYPGMVTEAARIKEVQMTRGERLQGGRAWPRFKAHLPMWFSLFQGSLDRAASIAEAMSARGFGSGRRTAYHRRRFRPRDALVAPLCLLLLGTALAAAVSGAGSYSFFPAVSLPWGGWSPAVAGAVALALAGLVSLTWSWKRWHWLRSRT
jgi:energy-coupling factor transport system permease protein